MGRLCVGERASYRPAMNRASHRVDEDAGTISAFDASEISAPVAVIDDGAGAAAREGFVTAGVWNGACGLTHHYLP